MRSVHELFSASARAVSILSATLRHDTTDNIARRCGVLRSHAGILTAPLAPTIATSRRFLSSSSSPTASTGEGEKDEMEWLAASLFTDMAPGVSSLRHSDSIRRDGAEDAEGLHTSTFTETDNSNGKDVDKDDESAHNKARRRRFLAAQALSDSVTHELRAEVQRDSRDGVAAIPPLAPPGWDVQYRPGTRLFTMTRTISGRHRRPAKDRVSRLSREDDLYDKAALCTVEDAEGPRFRSIHEEQQRRVRPRANDGPHSAPPHAHTAQGLRTPSSTTRPPLAHIARSDISLTLVAPFHVQDLSLVDPNVSICEHSTFDLIVRKHKPREHVGQPALHTVQGQDRVWSQSQCLFLSLASVNSELRLRHVQLISQTEARALEQYAFFGAGDPFFQALLQQQRRVVQRRYAQSLQTSARTRAAAAGLQQASSLSEPTTRRRLAQAGLPAGPAMLVHGGEAACLPSEAYTAETLLMQEPGYVGEVARRLCYRGPYLTELSKECREALMQYVVTELGMNSVLVEYVNQMLFFLEQEAYMGWLAQVGQLATTLQKRL